MGTLHSLAELKAHFDSVRAQDCSGKKARAPRGDVGYERLAIGAIVDIDGHHAIPDYHKDKGVRPALVTGLWRDAAGAIKKIELAEITTNLNRYHSDAFVLDTDELRQAFHRNKTACVKMGVVHIVENVPENFPVMNRRPRKIADAYWSDLILRRADAILHNASIMTRVQGMLSGLIREGVFFPSIKEENVRSHEFVPEICNSVFKKKPWDGMRQERINWLARYAEFYAQTQPSALRLSHRFPPSEEWPQNIPRISFKCYDKERGYVSRAPLLAAE